jgi:hypothetical protein
MNAGSSIPVFSSEQSMPLGDLYLRPGKYQLILVIEDDRVVEKKSIVVPDTSASPSGQP